MSSDREPVRHTSDNNSNSDILDAPDPTVGPLVALNSDSPLRVVVRCLSHKIPGRTSERIATIANIICQYYFQRDMDLEKEQITSLRLKDIDGKKVRFLLEYGTVPPLTRLDNIPIMAFKWNGKRL